MNSIGTSQTNRTRYDVTERKQAKLNALTIKIANAKFQVDQYGAIVVALTEKLNNFQDMLSIADINRKQALLDKNSVDQLVQSVLDLEKNSEIAVREMAAASEKANQLARNVKEVINKLIYTAEMINKLYIVVTRRKALNPLISDDLISQLAQAGNDANNAVTLTLLAVQSTFAAQASNIESEAATALSFRQSASLFQLLTGEQIEMNTGKNNILPFTFRHNQVPGSVASTDQYAGSLLGVLTQAHENAKIIYERDYQAVIRTTIQLNNAKSSLTKAEVKLKSLNSGLAAATAAALA